MGSSRQHRWTEEEGDGGGGRGGRGGGGAKRELGERGRALLLSS